MLVISSEASQKILAVSALEGTGNYYYLLLLCFFFVFLLFFSLNNDSTNNKNCSHYCREGHSILDSNGRHNCTASGCFWDIDDKTKDKSNAR